MTRQIEQKFRINNDNKLAMNLIVKLTRRDAEPSSLRVAGLTLTYLGGYFTPLHRLLADKKTYVSLSFWSPTRYIKIIKIGGETWGIFLVSSLVPMNHWHQNNKKTTLKPRSVISVEWLYIR